MTSKERVLERERNRGRLAAKELQNNAGTMTGTELYAEKDRIPDFTKACKKMNMLAREAGFVCKSTSGRVVKLLQPYDSTVYTSEPEGLPAQWGFVWSKEPEHALPYVAISTSPFNTGDCCTENDTVYRSLIDNNVWSPSAYPAGWEAVE